LTVVWSFVTLTQMRTIEKKVWPEYFKKILSGKKKFEVRLNDFSCQEGDVLVLREWDPQTQEYSGRSIEKEVVYIARTKNMTFWTKEEIDKYGYQIIGFD
jgi:ribosomal protein S17